MRFDRVASNCWGRWFGRPGKHHRTATIFRASASVAEQLEPRRLLSVSVISACNVGSNPNAQAAGEIGPDAVAPPPVITMNPSNQSIVAGATATFTAAATAYEVPTVQWQISTNGGKTFSNISGATSTTYTFTPSITQNGDQYRAVFTDSQGSSTTSAATLTVTAAPAPPTVTTNPTSQSAVAGTTATFTAAATAYEVPTVQWQSSTNGGKTFSNISGATSTTYSFTASIIQSGDQYRAVFTDPKGASTSSAATLTVTAAPAPPTVTLSPVSQTVPAGNTVTFTAAATGNPVPTVQWQISTNGGGTFTNISGATSTTHSFTAAANENGDKYRAVFTNSHGSQNTIIATLTVSAAPMPPIVTLDPTDQAAAAGDTVTFTVAATGNPIPTVQWQISTDDGGTFTDITGATLTAYTFTASTDQNGDQFQAVFTNSDGSATTSAATLTVSAAPLPPAVTTNPTTQVVPAGNTVTLIAAATGNPVPGVQWQISTDGGQTFTNITGATSTTYTFAASLDQSGDQFQAVFTNSQGTVTTSPAALTVTPANQLTFAVQPADSTTTALLAPVDVDVENFLGDLLGSDDSTVTLTLSGGSSSTTLDGATSVAAINGVATFSDVAVTTPGTYTLTATDGGDTPAASTSFTVYLPPETIGGLDFGFGVNGLASHDVGFAATAGIAQDGSQSVIAGVIGTAPNQSFGVTRYNADGSLDTTFGSGGVVNTVFGSTSDAPSAVAVLPGGQILVAGTATTYTDGVAGGSEFAVAEYNPDGSLDTSFGAGAGEVLISFSAAPGTLTDDLLNAMTVNKAGIIYLGGTSDAGGGGGTQFAIAALTASGALDTAFGSGGKVLLSFSAGGDDVINSLALQKNGELVAAGSATTGAVTDVALARFKTTGVLDKHFGAHGTVTTSVRGVFDSAASVVIQPNGAIVIGGASATESGAALSTDFLLIRYTPSGRIDKSFGHGPVITSFGQPSAVTQLALESDGDIIASGKTTASLGSVVPDQLEVAIARYTKRGVLDPTFNGNGKNIIDLSGNPAGASDAQVDAEIQIGPLDASSLGSEFNQFVGSEQGVVSMTPGGEILDAGNSGADTVEAEIITQGVDLAATLLTQPPASVAGGSKSIASVRIAEDGTLTAAGTIAVELEISNTPQGSGGTSVISLPERIHLKRLQNHTYKVHFLYPQNLTTADYYLVAVVNNGSSPALKDLNLENNTATSSSAVNIAPAFISLAAGALSTTSKFDPGKPATVTFTVTNNGNVTARGVTTVELLLSSDQTTADGTAVDTAKLPLNQPAAKTKVYHLSIKLPATLAPGAYYLIAVLDPLDDLGSIDRTSSTAVDPTQVTVG